MTIPRDKKLHFLAGLIIAFVVGLILSPIEGIGLAIAAGVFKECYDSFYKETKFDIADMIATWIGGAVGFAVVSLCKYWFG